MLSRDEQAFVQRRAQLQRWWPWAGAALLLAVLGLWGTLFLRRSLLVNPFAVMARLEAGELGAGTLAALALLGSVGFLTLGFVMLAVLALMWTAMRHERRLLDIIRRRCTPEPGVQRASEPPPPQA